MTDVNFTKITANLIINVRELAEWGEKTENLSRDELEWQFVRKTPELRKEAAQKLIDSGLSQRKAAEVLGVDKKTIYNDLGSNSPKNGEKIPTNGQLVQQSLSNEHYTPRRYIEAAKRVLGVIDLDPASCEEANTKIVNATKYYSENGLEQEWRGVVWLNPPYGGSAGDFVKKLSREYETGNVTEAITLVNAHCTDTSWFQCLWDGVLCFTDHRINFYGDDKRSGSTHGSVFAYFGSNEELFTKEFNKFGAVVKRV